MPRRTIEVDGQEWTVSDRDSGARQKKAASGGELPEAAVTAVRSRDTNGGGALKSHSTGD